MSTQVSHSDRLRVNSAGFIAFAAVAMAVVAFYGELSELVARWIRQDEYSHGFFIPLITLWLLWTRRDALRASLGRPSLGGFALVLFAALMHVVGQLSSFFLLSQLGFVIALLGIVGSI